MELVKVYFQDGRVEDKGYSSIRDYVTEDLNPENKKNVESVEVFGKFSALEDDLILIDTPGAGSLHKHHDAMLLKFIPQSDAVIFLVTSKAPIAEDELELLKKLKDADIKKVFFAVNKADATDDKDMETAIEHNRKLLSNVGIDVDKIYRISARNAMKGQLEGSGCQEMLNDVSAFISREKNNILRANFISNVLKVAQSLNCGMQLEIEAGSKSAEELQEEIENLAKQRSDIEKMQVIVETEFKAKWKMLVDEFESAIEAAEGSVEKKVSDKVESITVSSIGEVVKALPAFMASCIKEEIEPYSSRFENGAKEITEKIKMDYPSIINAGPNGLVSLGSATRNTSLLQGTLGGAMLAGVGGGAVAAASSSAALIVTTTTTTAAAPSIVAAIGGWFTSLGVPATTAIGNALGIVGTGTTATAVTTTSLAPWAALAGPIGWTLIGVGALVIPVSYYISKLKQKDKIMEATKSNIKKVFSDIKSKRIPVIRRLSEGIIENYRVKVLSDLMQISNSLDSTMKRKKAGKLVPVDEIRKEMQKLETLAIQADGFLKTIKI